MQKKIRKILCTIISITLISSVPAYAEPYDYKEVIRRVAKEVRGEDIQAPIGTLPAPAEESNLENTEGTKYNLSEDQIRTLAAICIREQGPSIGNVQACASHMCNYYERHHAGRYPSPYEAVIYSGWFGSASGNLSAASRYAPSQGIIAAVYDVICNGKRTLPLMVDEFDCLSDVVSASNNGAAFNPRDRGQYISGVTRVRNRYGSSYTFYCFPDGPGGIGDAFGYT